MNKSKIKTAVVLCFLLLYFLPSEAQVSYYAASFHGGVTGGGYSPDYFAGGTDSFYVYIEPGSTIHQAYLLAGRHGVAPSLTVTLNGTSFTFDNSNQASPTFQSPFYGGNSGVHAIDVTANINPAITSYTITVPNQGGPADRFNDFYLFIAYDNAALPVVHTEIFLNTLDLQPVSSYNFNLSVPIDTTSPVGIALFTGYECSNADGDSVFLNSTYLGYIYGPDYNSGSCGGPVANFYYQNNNLFALSDDNANQSMNGPDVLSNSQTLMPNQSTTFTMEFRHPNQDNAKWAFIVTYSDVSCVPPVVNAGIDVTLCPNDSAQLNVSGIPNGSAIAWTPSAGLSCSNCSNPIANPTGTTTYIVQVTDSSGCSGRDTLTITRIPPIILNFPREYYICGESGGSVMITASGGTTYLWTPGATLTDSTIANPVANVTLTTSYTVTVSNGSCSDTAHVTVYLLSPPPPPTFGQAGDSIYSQQSYLNYQWYLNGFPIAGATDSIYVVPLSGTYALRTTDSLGCSGISNGLYVTITLVKDFSINNELVIIPNPARDHFEIAGLTVASATLQLYNVLGEVIYQTNIQQETRNKKQTSFDISLLSNGVYFLRLEMSGKVYHAKIVKQ